jgi:hypothetical protein
MIVIQTQIHENYAWVDGELLTGSEAYWKPKGGAEYKVLGVPEGANPEAVVELLRDKIEVANDAFLEAIIGYSVEAEDYLSWFEKSQLDFEGKITYAEPVINYKELLNV